MVWKLDLVEFQDQVDDTQNLLGALCACVRVCVSVSADKFLENIYETLYKWVGIFIVTLTPKGGVNGEDTMLRGTKQQHILIRK